MITKCRSLIGRKTRRETGAAAVEYAMIVGLLSVLAVLAAGPFADALNAIITAVTEAVAGA